MNQEKQGYEEESKMPHEEWLEWQFIDGKVSTNGVS